MPTQTSKEFISRAELLDKEAKLNQTQGISTPLNRLNNYFKDLNLYSSVIEWGAPSGRLSRLIPLLILGSTQEKVLWFCDEMQEKFYANALNSLSINSSNFYFICEKDVQRSLRAAVNEDSCKILVIDTKTFISKSDLNFLSTKSRLNQSTYFLMRHFFLSNKNGNPFVKYRINSSYDLRSDCFKVNCIKGLSKKSLVLKRDEVF